MSLVFAISSGIGCDGVTVINSVCRTLSRLELAIPYTTRKTAEFEQLGGGFRLISQDAFESLIEHDELLEYVKIHGNYYGTSLCCLQRAQENRNDLLACVDESGVSQIKRRIPDAISILLVPGQSPEKPRLKFFTASTMAQEVMRQTLREALERPRAPDPALYDYVVKNNGLAASVRRLVEIIRTERSK